MNQEFYDAVEANPVIAAVKHDDGLQAAVEMEEYLHDPGDCGSDQRFREKGAGAYRFDRRTQYERNFRGVYQTADKSRRDHHNQTGVGAAGKRAGAFYRTALFCD